jgi:hypothetical protein
MEKNTMVTIGDLAFSPEIENWLAERNGHAISVLSGLNDSGKSAALKVIRHFLGKDAYLLACSRFYSHTHVAGNVRPDQQKADVIRELDQEFRSGQNSEINRLELNELIVQLDNRARERLFELAGTVLGGKFELRSRDPGNVFSTRIVYYNDRTLGAASSGTRLMLTILGTCLDSRFHTVLLDEPELGLSPRAQRKIAELLFNDAMRKAWFPHLKQVFLVTHSHLFLDRSVYQNNFILQRAGDAVSITQVTSIAAFHNLQFNLLGNDLEALFLPSAVVVVEGPTDQSVLRRAFLLRFPDKRITVVNAGDEGQMGAKLHMMSEILGDLSTSPYRSRVFFLLDAVHSIGKKGTRAKILAKHALPENIVTLSQNGIEHYYPEVVVGALFGGATLASVRVNDDDVSANGIEMKKADLAARVENRLTAEAKFGGELETLFDKVSSAIA